MLAVFNPSWKLIKKQLAVIYILQYAHNENYN